MDQKIKTVLDNSTRTEIIKRISLLTESNKPIWGKMNIYQMLIHCRIWSDWVHGKGEFQNLIYKQDFLGKIFGKMALKSTVKDNRFIGKNLPAGFLAVKEQKIYDLNIEKDKWIHSVEDYEHFANERFVHDFFGRMTDEQIGIFVYKHFDHHLRQFGV